MIMISNKRLKRVSLKLTIYSNLLVEFIFKIVDGIKSKSLVYC
jgi:hypothetical protein